MSLVNCADLPGNLENRKRKLHELLKHYEEGRSDDGWLRREHGEEINLQNMDTPYGKLVKSMEILVQQKKRFRRRGAQPYTIKYICPFALLWATCEENLHFFLFLRHYVRMNLDAFKASSYWDGAKPDAEPPARIVLYEDAVTPGNVHRHDKGLSLIHI